MSISYPLIIIYNNEIELLEHADESAAQMAVGLGAEVVVLDRNIDVLRALDAQFGLHVPLKTLTTYLMV